MCPGESEVAICFSTRFANRLNGSRNVVIVSHTLSLLLAHRMSKTTRNTKALLHGGPRCHLHCDVPVPLLHKQGVSCKRLFWAVRLPDLPGARWLILRSQTVCIRKLSKHPCSMSHAIPSSSFSLASFPEEMGRWKCLLRANAEQNPASKRPINCHSAKGCMRTPFLEKFKL